VTVWNQKVAPKRLELLHELVPSARVAAFLVNPANPASTEPVLRASQAAARTLGLGLHVLNASTESDFDGLCKRDSIASERARDRL
jgi:putative tryptophan/tyrosine transport system substrate-binding protein